ncbi:MAG: aspartate--tRNA ligase [Deltaproteobacteria bacterium]|nr:aspartate--tRNA ligase [Deltaproteobacteria bacterium]
METLGNWRRSCYCGEASPSFMGAQVILMGWVQRRRDHGGLIFVDLRDREGIVQLVFNPAEEPLTHEKAHTIRCEYVIAVKGTVSKRPVGTENPSLKTGAVEIKVKDLKILTEAAAPPFLIEDSTDAGEDVRLKYRYLDLRRPGLQKNLIIRHRVCLSARDYLSKNGFLEIETPVLTKSTPEGARDFLVPSRLNPGHFYALPQSPQLFKQILMVSGFDRYFQIVKCYRDEDLRADRQPEFTQIDLEMSFVDREDVMGLSEGLLSHIFKEVMGVELKNIPRMTYEEAVGRYGLDKPDVRFALELKDVTDAVRASSFKVFSDAISKGGIVKAICVKGVEFTRKELDELAGIASTFGGKGLAWVKVSGEGWQSPIAKFFGEEDRKRIDSCVGARGTHPKDGSGDLILFSADRKEVVNTVLGMLRVFLGNRLNLIPKEGFSFVWVTDFPLFEYDETEKRYVSVHHPFTSFLDEDAEKLETNPLGVRSKAYDMVLNGEEIGGGSIRVHGQKVQSKIFDLLGIGKEEAGEKFGFLLDALSFGTPPHGGIAFGLDRIIAIMTGSDSIRDVIAFPKTQRAFCMMSAAPSEVDKKQLDELSLKVVKKE